MSNLLKLIQESEELRDVQDEFENNRSTKISQKDVDELMQELFDAYELDQEEKKQGKRHKRRDCLVKIKICFCHLMKRG